MAKLDMPSGGRSHYDSLLTFREKNAPIPEARLRSGHAREVQRRHEQRYQGLLTERSSWDSHWREVSDYVFPRKTRFSGERRDRGWTATRRNDKIINNRATIALRTLQAGMMAGQTSPSRPWYRLTLEDNELARYPRVQRWLWEMETITSKMMLKSNIYNSLSDGYGNLGGFGTDVLFIDDDPEDHIRGYVLPVGSYVLQNGPRLSADVLYREVAFTVGSLIERFGLEACSKPVREAYDKGNYDQAVFVRHCIYPRAVVKQEDYSLVPSSLWPWGSVWYEADTTEGLLYEGGYRVKPFCATRWTTTGDDVYGQSPIMECLGDIKALQAMEKRKAMAVEKTVNPPLQAPATLERTGLSQHPGFTNYIPGTAQVEVKPVYTLPHPRTAEIILAVQEIEQRIDVTLFVPLFAQLMFSDRRQMTAREVEERHEEKLMQLGPVIERQQDERLDPLITAVMDIGWSHGLFPPPPEEVQGMELAVDYISILAQSQKVFGVSGMERLTAHAINAAPAVPDSVKAINWPRFYQEYGDMLGVPPTILNSPEEIEAINEQEQRAIQAAQMAEAAKAANQGAQAAKHLSEVDPEGADILRQTGEVIEEATA